MRGLKVFVHNMPAGPCERYVVARVDKGELCGDRGGIAKTPTKSRRPWMVSSVRMSRTQDDD